MRNGKIVKAKETVDQALLMGCPSIESTIVYKNLKNEMYGTLPSIPSGINLDDF